MFYIIAILFKVKGVKGASVMCKHRGFDLVQGVAIDTLHVVYLGVTSDLLSYWFDKKHARKSFNIRRKVRIHVCMCVWKDMLIVQSSPCEIC